MELRGQAHYTMKLFGGDLNLCRAYIPYKCYTYDKNSNKVEYDNKNELHKKYFNKYKWFTIEDDKEWKPTDLHTQTTINAFGADIVNHPDFKHYRKYGKTANFAKGVCYFAHNSLYYM